LSEQAFLSLLKQNQAIIYKLVHVYAQSDEDKKDIYQEIVLQAWKAFPNFRGDSKFSTWLYRLCLNTIFTLNRKVKKITYTDDTGQFEDRLTTTHNDDAERLYKAIRTLPETERAIVSLHLDGYGNNEMSEILGITANAVGVKLHRAKQQLANILKNV